MAKAGRGDDQYMVRFPSGMRDRVKAAAADHGQSMNDEIISRLQQSLDGAFLDLSGVGFVAMVKRLEATVEASESLFYSLRDDLPVVDELMRRKNLSRAEALRFIVSEWACERTAES